MSLVIMTKSKCFLTLLSALFAGMTFAQNSITVSIPQDASEINPLIYGQMLEDCNDKIIYGGLINADGSEHPKVKELLKPLNIPIMRWPAGTYIHEYDWEKGIGLMKDRPPVLCSVWGGVETNQFGTDEFLRWCIDMKITPYINLNMGNDPVCGGSLGDAINWIDYCNASADTNVYAAKRKINGRAEPYNVRYWCIGNENYESWGRHTKETPEVYAKKLRLWASTIRSLYPDLILIGVGHTLKWNEAILNECGDMIDILSMHYYVSAKMKDSKLENPEKSLFMSDKFEANLIESIIDLNKANEKFGRKKNPITFTIDEWNTRHSKFNGEKYERDRHDYRRQFDIVTTAGMLNVFIRQSPYVSMANYIFPVNGHGLIKTIDEKDAYESATYQVFKIYRELLIGKKLDAKLDCEFAEDVNTKTLSGHGDINAIKSFHDKKLTYLDSAAALRPDGAICVSIINRSHLKNQNAKLNLPENYKACAYYEFSSDDINLGNKPGDRNAISPKFVELKEPQSEFVLKPCALLLIVCKKTENL